MLTRTIDPDCRRVIEESGIFSHPQLHKHIHSGSGSGVVKALTAVRLKPGHSWSSSFQKLPADQRKELRAYLLQVGCTVLQRIETMTHIQKLLNGQKFCIGEDWIQEPRSCWESIVHAQERWFSGLQWSPGTLAAGLKTLKSLPIYEVAAAPGGEGPEGAPSSPSFVDLSHRDLHMVPATAPQKSTLTELTVMPGSLKERSELSGRLGVQQWSLSRFYRHVLLMTTMLNPNPPAFLSTSNPKMTNNESDHKSTQGCFQAMKADLGFPKVRGIPSAMAFSKAARLLWRLKTK